MVTRIDPERCACTDCLVGDSIPLQLASPRQVLDMLNGDLMNATGDLFSVATLIVSDNTGRRWQTPQAPKTRRVTHG